MRRQYIQAILSCLGLMLLIVSCNTQESKMAIAYEVSQPITESSDKPPLSKEFSDYWYSGEAEITSYQLQQERYGEIRDGKAVLIFVTEDFLPETQVKAENYNNSNIPVLKLNATKNFNTGIYPYSIMQSTFYPVSNNGHALKVSCSVQEWCGQVYAQLNNRTQFEVMAHSYFQGEADQKFELNKTYTENELWTKLRIDPQSLPTGELSIIPSLEYTRLKHKDIMPYLGIAMLENGIYTLTYPNLNRSLKIYFNTNFPYEINGWEETTFNGYGSETQSLTTKATKLKRQKTAYWRKNSNSDLIERERLNLE